MSEVWMQFATVAGPTAAIAALALWSNYQVMIKLMGKFDQLEENNQAVAKALGEVTGILIRLNGNVTSRSE